MFLKADEEFNIEKVKQTLFFHFLCFNFIFKQAKIVRQESLAIDAVFERKIKQAEVQKRM